MVFFKVVFECCEIQFKMSIAAMFYNNNFRTVKKLGQFVIFIPRKKLVEIRFRSGNLIIGCSPLGGPYLGDAVMYRKLIISRYGPSLSDYVKKCSSEEKGVKE